MKPQRSRRLRPMRALSFLFPALALGGAAFLMAPAHGFTKNGGSLNLNHRHFRIHNNFQDATANNNFGMDPQFPDALGAELAIWKGYVEWGSGLYGDGSGDPLEGPLGDGGANFDAAYGGDAALPGTTNRNTVSAISGCIPGLVAFTETPVTDGWRIRFCESQRFADGPAGPGFMRWDIQGVAAHEFGHALGLGHTAVVGATMEATGVSGIESTLARSIEPDDIAGLQCIYGLKDAAKPEISAVSELAGSLTIDGVNFGATDNEVWFTSLAITDPNDDPIVRVTGVPSSLAGTQIVVAVPAAAGPGNVLVKVPGTGHEFLSNAFPSDVGKPAFPMASVTFRNGAGVNATCMSSLNTPVIGTDWMIQVDASGHAGATFTNVACYIGGQDGPIFSAGQILVDASTPKCFRMIMTSSGGLDVFTVPIPMDASLLGLKSTIQATIGGGLLELCNAEDVCVGL